MERPGYVIPTVWFRRFTLPGIARYILPRPPASDVAWLVLSLAVVCALYAYYTIGVSRFTGISALGLGPGGTWMPNAFRQMPQP